MKRIAILVLPAVLVLAACGNFWNPGVRVYDVKNWTIPSAYSNALTVQVDTGSVIVEQGTTAGFEIVMSNYVDAGGYTAGMEYLSNRVTYSLTTNSNGITFVHSSSGVADGWNIYQAGAYIVVKVPAGVDPDTVSVTTSAGEATVSGLTVKTSVKISTEAGSIEVSGLNVPSANFDASAGSIAVSNLTSTSNTFTASTGSIDIEDSSIVYLTVSSEAGSVSLNGVSGTSLNATASTGSIMSGKDGVNYDTLTLNVDTGTIDMALFDLVAIDASTSTGSIILDVDSFKSAGNSQLTAGTGSIDFNILKANASNLMIDASVELGSIANAIDFESSTQTLRSFTGKNGTGANYFNMKASTGSIFLNDSYDGDESSLF